METTGLYSNILIPAVAIPKAKNVFTCIDRKRTYVGWKAVGIISGISVITTLDVNVLHHKRKRKLQREQWFVQTS